MAIAELLGGFVVGIGSKILLDKLAEPRVEIDQTIGEPMLLKDCEFESWVLKQASCPNIRADVLAYRVRVTNRQKSLLNAPARNCVAWLDVDGSPESYQLSWVGAKESVTINVGDWREIDVCGLPLNWGTVIAPIDSGYNFPRPRLIGAAGVTVCGWLRVTAENGAGARARIMIDVDPSLRTLNITLGMIQA